MTAIFCILPNSNAALSEPGTHRPSIRIGDSSIRLNRVVVRHALSEADASKRFVDWLLEAKWSAIDTLRDMQADPYDVHIAATFLASRLRDRSRPFDLVQRVQDLYTGEYDIYFDPYAPAQFRFLDERNPGEVIASLRMPVRMRDRAGYVGTTPFSSIAPALAKTDALIYVKGGDSNGVWVDYRPPAIEWFVDDLVDEGVRIFDRPGTASFVYPDGERIVIDLPGDGAIVGIDVGNATDDDALCMSVQEWSTTLLRHSMIYAPKRREPALALYDDIIAWVYRHVKFHSEKFDDSLEALRKALIELLDVDMAADLECDEVISGAERFLDVLDELMQNGFNALTVLRKTERGVLMCASDAGAQVDRWRSYFVMENR